MWLSQNDTTTILVGVVREKSVFLAFGAQDQVDGMVGGIEFQRAYRRAEPSGLQFGNGAPARRRNCVRHQSTHVLAALPVRCNAARGSRSGSHAVRYVERPSTRRTITQLTLALPSITKGPEMAPTATRRRHRTLAAGIHALSKPQAPGRPENSVERHGPISVRPFCVPLDFCQRSAFRNPSILLPTPVP